MKLSEHILRDGNKKSSSRDFMGWLGTKERTQPLCESPPACVLQYTLCIQLRLCFSSFEFCVCVGVHPITFFPIFIF